MNRSKGFIIGWLIGVGACASLFSLIDRSKPPCNLSAANILEVNAAYKQYQDAIRYKVQEDRVYLSGEVMHPATEVCIILNRETHCDLVSEVYRRGYRR